MEKVVNIFDALRLLNDLKAQEEFESLDPETIEVRKRELQAYIKVSLKQYADKAVRVITEHVPDDPQEPTEVVITFHDAVHFYEAVSLHIGRTGFFIKGEPRFPIDTLLKIHVRLEKEDVEFTVSGKVVWVNPKPSKNKPEGMGIKLYKLGDIQKELLMDFKKGNADPYTLTALSELA